jgi:hypothetical protein
MPQILNFEINIPQILLPSAELKYSVYLLSDACRSVNINSKNSAKSYTVKFN